MSAPDPSSNPEPAQPPVVRAFLFTDIEGSSQLMERAESVFKRALKRHDELLGSVAVQFAGQKLGDAGDGFLFTFDEPASAVGCAVEFQRRVGAEPWPESIGQLRVRAAVGYGEVTPHANGEYRGLPLNRTARLMGAAHGGQVVCGRAVADAARGASEFLQLGWFHLRGLTEPEQVFQLCWSEMPSREFPPLRTTPVVPCNLPRTVTAFFGRQAEKATLSNWLLDPQGPRLVVLTGPGGTGKTRLSLAVAEQVRKPLADAVWFIPLADLDDPELLPTALRDALQLPINAPESPLEQVAAFLNARPSLLVLDNFEQLVPNGGDILLQLLQKAPALRCLASSRQRIGLPGEREFPVDALPIPPAGAELTSLAGYASVELFLDRAASVRAGFSLTPENSEPIAQICRRLQGVPLALELAASRADVVSPKELLEELGRRLDFSAKADSALPSRHRSLRAAIDWSYAFLPVALQRFFDNLAVFRGGWTADAARAVAQTADLVEATGDARRALSELRVAALIRVDEVDGGMRFHLLETIRAYAAEKLAQRADATDTATRHAKFFADLAEEAERAIHGPNLAVWYARLDREVENIRAALTNCGESELLPRLATALPHYWQVRGLDREGRQWMERCIALSENFPPKLRGTVYYCAGLIAMGVEDWEAAERCYREALMLFRELGNAINVAALYANLGVVALRRGEIQEALRWHEESASQYEKLDHPTREAVVLNNLAEICLDLGNLERASEIYRRSLILCEKTQDRETRAVVLQGMGQVSYFLGQGAEAEAQAREAIEINRRIRHLPFLLGNALLLGCALEHQGRDREAIRWHAAAHWLGDTFRNQESRSLVDAGGKSWAHLQARADAAVLAEESAAGVRMARPWKGDSDDLSAPE